MSTRLNELKTESDTDERKSFLKGLLSFMRKAHRDFLYVENMPDLYAFSLNA